MFYILVIRNDNAQVIFVLLEVCQPGGAAVNFAKIAKNQNRTFGWQNARSSKLTWALLVFITSM